MSICDKNKPPERSSEELELAQQERERVESIIRNETLDDPTTTEIPETVRGDTNQFNKLANIEKAIDKISGGKELKVSKIADVEKQVQADGVIADTDEIIRIAEIKNAILLATSGSSNVIFRNQNPSNKSDCAKKIEDLLLQELKKLIMKLIREADGPKALVELAPVLKALSGQMDGIFKLVDQVKNASLGDLLILAKNAGLLDRIGIIQDITKKFGGVISNLNSILAVLDKFDVCNMLDFNIFGGILPQPLKINPDPSPFYPDPGQLITRNPDAERLSAGLIHHRMTAGDFINGSYSGTNLKNDPSNGSLKTALSALYYGFKNEVSKNGTSGFAEKADKEIQRVINSKRDEWDGLVLNEFSKRGGLLRDLVIEDADLLQEDENASNNFTTRGITGGGNDDPVVSIGQAEGLPVFPDDQEDGGSGISAGLFPD